MQKICPLMSREKRISPHANTNFIDCQHEKCALWILGYTSEKVMIECCAFEFMALKNAEGLYRV